MKSYKLLLLLPLLASCVDPNSLDRMQEYAETKLEKNIKEYSSMELKRWWRSYFRNEAHLVFANAKAFEKTTSLISRDDKHEEKSSETLLDQLIKLYELNISLRELSQQNLVLSKKDETTCLAPIALTNLNLKAQIERNYLAGLKFPTMAETYMIGGGTGEDGLSKSIEAITTSLGSLFNRDKIRTLKKKIKKVKRTYAEKMPSEKVLKEASYIECMNVLKNEKEYEEMTVPLSKEMVSRADKEWSYYLQTKSKIGRILLDRKFQENTQDNDEIKRKLGFSAMLEIRSNLAVMRQYGFNLVTQYRKLKNIVAREELEDFVKSFEGQLQTVQAWERPNLETLLKENRSFINELKGVLNE